MSKIAKLVTSLKRNKETSQFNEYRMGVLFYSSYKQRTIYLFIVTNSGTDLVDHCVPSLSFIFHFDITFVH